jgi:plastocyanin
MSRMNRRRFTWVATSGFASAALVACSGDAVQDDITPTRIADVEGAPPTLAPNATPFSSDTGDEGGGGAAPAGAGEAITVTGLDSLTFDPSEFEAAPGQTIHFVNGGALQHDFIVDELGITMDPVDGGGEVDVTVPDDAEVGQSYTYYCSLPGHREAGMEGTLTIVEAGAGGEAAASEEDGGEAAAAGGGEPITVTGLDSLEFDPSSFEATPGQTIHFVNGGALQHDFIVDELGITMDLVNGGEEIDVTVPEDAAPGDYTYYCSVPGHREAGMEGTMTVVEGGGGEAAAATGEEDAPAEETEAAAAGEGGGSAEPITVNALDALQFDPSEFEAAPGQEIHVVNGGSLQHDFIIDELGMATDMLNGGDEQTITVPDDAEVGQSYTFYCSVPGHRQAGMEGTMTIVEAGGGAAAGEESAPAEETEEAAAAPAGPVDASQPVEVTALDSLVFEPSEIAVAPGQTIRVTNDGALQHDFVVDEWGLATALLNNGETGELVVPGDAAIGASYTYYCSVPGHAAAGMQGTLTVAEAVGGEGAATEAPEEGTPAANATEGAAQMESGAEVEPDAIRVAALDSMRFAPSEFSAAPGQQIYLVNPGVLVHDIVVDEWGLDSGALGGSEETTFNIPDDAEIGAEIEFYCSVPGHRESGMVGRITIIEADVTQEEAVTPVAGASPVGEAATPVVTEEAAAATPAAAEASPAASASGGGGGGAIEVHTLDTLTFDPSEFTAVPGQEIHVINDGVMQHDFIIDELDMATDLLNNGEEQTITVPEDAEPGEYTFYCSVPGHQQAGMEGTMTVE